MGNVVINIEDNPTPCEVYNCNHQEQCKQGQACMSFRYFAWGGQLKPPTEPSEQMFNHIFGDE